MLLRHVVFSTLIIISHAESTENPVDEAYKKLLKQVINVNKKRMETIVKLDQPTKFNFAKLIGRSRDEDDEEIYKSNDKTTEEHLVYIILEQNPNANSALQKKKNGKELIINHDHTDQYTSSDDSDVDSDSYATIEIPSSEDNKSYKLSQQVILRKRHNWMKKCLKHAQKMCKKACKDSYKNMCTSFACKSKMKKKFKKECKNRCKNEFQESRSHSSGVSKSRDSSRDSSSDSSSSSDISGSGSLIEE